MAARKKSRFYTDIWPALECRGWKLEEGTRPSDHYFVPPGVVRGPGFRNRHDFFDSAKQVINCVLNESKWKSDEALQKIVMDLENNVPSTKKSSTRAKRGASTTKQESAKKIKRAPQDKPEEKTNECPTTAKINNTFELDENRFTREMWPELEKLGWRTETGRRDGEMYFIPPGAQRNAPFKAGRDYFDSVSQCYNFIKNDIWWNSHPGFKAAVSNFESTFSNSTSNGETKTDPPTTDKQKEISPKALFHRVVLPVLNKLGWKETTDDNGTQYETDKSYKYSTYSEVLTFLKNDANWKTNLQIKECILIYEGSLSLWDRLKNTSERPATDDEQKLISWIVSEYRLMTAGLYV